MRTISSSLPLLLPLALLSTALPSSNQHAAASSTTTQPPLIIWHGLGDSSDSEGMQQITDLIEKTNPGTYVHRIGLGGDDSTSDRKASFFGNVTTQLDTVCDELAANPNLTSAPYINALGFSQGGQFLRGYVQRCNHPPVRNLVTFGSQHGGIARFQSCEWSDWLCRGANGLLMWGRWTQTAQSQFVPAQYYRDAADLDDYLQYSNYLADINNERAKKNTTYKRNLSSLNRFAMFMFEDDTLVFPKQSAWFADYNSSSDAYTPLRERALYAEDWVGLKALDEQGKLHFNATPGPHMHLTEGLLEKTFRLYFGPVASTADFDRESGGDGGLERVLVKQGSY